ncbi:MAG: type 4a pilus biogenesis protein PilO [Desulfobia sp.]
MSAGISKIQEQIISFTDKKILPLGQSKKIAIWLTALLIPCLAFYFLYYTSKTEEIAELKQQQSQLNREIAKVKAASKKIKQHRAEMKEVETMFDLAAKLLPEKQEIPSLLTSISEIGRASGLDFNSFTPQGESKKQFYAEIPVDIKVQCSFHDIGVFLDKISKLDRIVTVSNLNIGSSKKTEEEVTILNTSFRLITYRFLDSS